MLGTQPLMNDAATKTAVQNARCPRILHLATHGIFLVVRPQHETTAIAAVTPGAAVNPWHLSAMQRAADPLLRSGLALAGANTWLSGGTPPPEAGNSLLTALELATLDLRATNLVVLSACDTGLGDVHVGEGVFGLRRAFAVAGAKALVMSLWSVPDAYTQELMTVFYEYQAGLPLSEALRRARLTMMRSYPDRIAWGAFIFEGNPNANARVSRGRRKRTDLVC